MTRASVEPEAFVEDPHLHTKCGFHVQVIYYGHSIATVVCDLLGILVGMLLFFYPHKFRETTIYRQFLQHYDRTQAYHYQLFYNISCLGWISLFFLHILAIGGAILEYSCKNHGLCCHNSYFYF
uniref:Uncharacterized protein n=1 Tax=Ditylenchus dipsaci TaxID=166011 RepID=A0A915CKZ7_9BILA